MEWMRESAVCFTGHRQIAPGSATALRDATTDVVRSLISRGFDTFITGGALGFDTIAQIIVLSMKREFPYLRTVMAIPCECQDAQWSTRDRALYRQLRKRADAEIVLSQTYSAACMHARNRYMVEHSAICVAYFNGEWHSGTGATVRYAKQCSVPVICVQPGKRPHMI